MISSVTIVGIMLYFGVAVFNYPKEIVEDFWFPFKARRDSKIGVLISTIALGYYMIFFEKSLSRSEDGSVLFFTLVLILAIAIYAFLSWKIKKVVEDEILLAKKYSQNNQLRRRVNYIGGFFIVLVVICGAIYFLSVSRRIKDINLLDFSANISDIIFIVFMAMTFIFLTSFIIGTMTEIGKLASLSKIYLTIDSKYEKEIRESTAIIPGYIVGTCSDGCEYYIFKQESDGHVRLIKKELIIDITPCKCVRF